MSATSIDPDTSADSTVLLASLLNLSIPHYLTPVLTSATKITRRKLVIVLYSRLFEDPETDDPAKSHTGLWDTVQSLLTFIYVQTSKVAQDLNNPLLQVDILLKGLTDTLPESTGTAELLLRVSGESILNDVPLPPQLKTARVIHLQSTGVIDRSFTVAKQTPYPSLYRVVAVGGTFDHLHAGHKILLSMTAWIAKEKIIVGVTDDVLLKKKSNQQVLESIDVRMQHIRDFLAAFRPGLIYDVVPIQDVYGPTGWDPDVQGLVVSTETMSGADAIASHRKEKGFPPLQTFVIDVISATSTNINHEDAELLRQTKMSSTYLRQWIVDNIIGHEPRG